MFVPYIRIILKKYVKNSEDRGCEYILRYYEKKTAENFNLEK